MQLDSGWSFSINYLGLDPLDDQRATLIGLAEVALGRV